MSSKAEVSVARNLMDKIYGSELASCSESDLIEGIRSLPFYEPDLRKMMERVTNWIYVGPIVHSPNLRKVKVTFTGIERYSFSSNWKVTKNYPIRGIDGHLTVKNDLIEIDQLIFDLLIDSTFGEGGLDMRSYVLALMERRSILGNPLPKIWFKNFFLKELEKHAGFIPVIVMERLNRDLRYFISSTEHAKDFNKKTKRKKENQVLKGFEAASFLDLDGNKLKDKYEKWTCEQVMKT